MSSLRELVASRELLANLTMREVKGKYRRTVFGQLWSLINPLATMVVYTIVFSFIFRANPPAGDPSGVDVYPLWLMCGLLPWTFFTRVVTGGMASLTSNGSLIKKVYFPRSALPLSVVGSTGFTWLNEMALLAVALLIFGSFVLPWLPVVLLTMIALAAFSAGIAMLLAIVNVYFRDTQHFVGILLQMWMYFTPIIYPIHLVEAAAADHGQWILDVYRLNPMERFVAVFRSLLYDNRFPDLADSLWCVGWAVVALVAGFLVFTRNEKRLAELL
jgi:ABC-2 type transport system permease protein